jgi:hypothetical protein
MRNISFTPTIYTDTGDFLSQVEETWRECADQLRWQYIQIEKGEFPGLTAP